MMNNKAELVVEKMERMADLLKSGGYIDWSISIFKLAEEYKVDPDNTRQTFRSFYGGMGSLNDLVLHRDGTPLLSENDELDLLRSDLFKLLS